MGCDPELSQEENGGEQQPLLPGVDAVWPVGSCSHAVPAMMSYSPWDWEPKQTLPALVAFVGYLVAAMSQVTNSVTESSPPPSVLGVILIKQVSWYMWQTHS